MLRPFHRIPERDRQTDGRTIRQTNRIAVSISAYLQRYPRPPSWNKGAYFLGEVEGRGREGRTGEGEERRKEEGEGRKGDGEKK